ncbi:MAG: glycosyltransferase family 2 protein [Negativicutes bacterium]|nr:glycosyltransferase family 2 protein [Negativicutes bacterium]
MNLTIIIPTYNERENVAAIVKRLQCVMSEHVSVRYEVLFIDDSTDDTPARLEALAKEHPEVRYIHRSGERGLASAVVKGFEAAKGEQMIVMDADLQHPPELIPLILKRLSEADIVIPSRFIDGGTDGGLNQFRKFVSWTARTIGRLSIMRLRDISDCTGGYFGLNRNVIEGVALNPVGWKILMEVLVKGNYRTVHEIPYAFVARDAGQSKMNVKEQWNYLRHIVKLVSYSEEDRRFYAFCLVGLLGVLVNLASLAMMLTFFPVDELAASITASLIAMIHNFILNDTITWKISQNLVIWRRVLRFPQYVLVSTLGILATAFLARLFMAATGDIYIGQLIGISVSTYGSFLANNRWTWAGPEYQAGDSQKLIVTQEYWGKIT